MGREREGATDEGLTKEDLKMGETAFRHRDDSGVDPVTEDLARAVIGAAIGVHRELFPGLSESTYKLALSRELTLRQIPHRLEVPVPILYKGELVGEGRVDILVAARLVLELKSVESLAPVHSAQAKGYLVAMKLQLALILNFNVPIMRDGIKRIINTFFSPS
jgi:GxxExxY protein